MKTTRIGRNTIVVAPGPKSIVRFSGGQHGPAEAGDYEFWDLHGEGVVYTGRARTSPGADPGRRWQIMKDSKQEARGYAWASTRATKLSPSTLVRIEKWLNQHWPDAGFARTARVGGRKYKLAAKFRLK